MENKSSNSNYTKIPNDVLENISKIRLTPTQHEIVYVIWRYTYGFHRYEHTLSSSFFEYATGRNSREIRRALKSLIERKIIKQKLVGPKRIIRLNDEISEWISNKGGENSLGQNSPPKSIKIPLLTEGDTPPQEIKKESIKEKDSNYISYEDKISSLSKEESSA